MDLSSCWSHDAHLHNFMNFWSRVLICIGQLHFRSWTPMRMRKPSNHKSRKNTPSWVKMFLILIPQKGPIDIRGECNGSDPTWVWPTLPGRRYDKEETWVCHHYARVRQDETSERVEECPPWRYQSRPDGLVDGSSDDVRVANRVSTVLIDRWVKEGHIHIPYLLTLPGYGMQGHRACSSTKERNQETDSRRYPFLPAGPTHIPKFPSHDDRLYAEPWSWSKCLDKAMVKAPMEFVDGASDGIVTFYEIGLYELFTPTVNVPDHPGSAVIKKWSLSN